MKTLGSGHVLRANVVTAKDSLDYIWSQPVSTIVSGIDTEQVLKANAGMAKSFKPLGQTARSALLTRTKDKGLTGDFEPFKTPPNFDGPIGRKLHGLS